MEDLSLSSPPPLPLLSSGLGCVYMQAQPSQLTTYNLQPHDCLSNIGRQSPNVQTRTVTIPAAEKYTPPPI